MAPKHKAKGSDFKQEEILQAVVIADSFNVRFAPATEKKPRALLPLVNVPMLDYVLDFLHTERVQETIVFCCSHSDQIRAHIRDSKWGDDKTRMSVKIVLAEGSRSMGDALREIHSRSLIRNDFFLLNCDTVPSVNLKQLMEEHRQRREQIKSCVLTMHCMERNLTHKSRSSEDNIILGLEHDTMRILHYERMCSLPRKIKIPFKYPNSTIRCDLMDCQLYICSPVLLYLFTDNFDYCSLEDFIRGIITNEEIFGNTMYVSLLKNDYCCRITNPYMYEIVSQDIMTRMSMPITPQLLLGRRTEPVHSHGSNIYESQGCKIARNAHMVRNVVIGKGSTVGAKAYLMNAVIGENCKIGANVSLINCYIWDGVTIEDDCKLNTTIVCDGVTVYTNTTVQPQTLLSYNVKVGPDVTLSPNIRLQDTPMEDEFEDEEDATEDTPVTECTKKYGAKSQAFLYTAATEDSDDEDEELFSAEWGEPIVAPTGDDFHDSSDASVELKAAPKTEEMDEFASFYAELKDTLLRAKKEKITLDNMILEINSLKHAYNIPINDVHCALVKVLVEIPLWQERESEGKVLLPAVLKHFKTHIGLMKHYIKNRESQMDCIHTLEDYAVESELALSVMSKVVYILYDVDILEEDVILKWYNTEPDEDEIEDHRKIRKEMEEFVKWLEMAEVEDSEED